MKTVYRQDGSKVELIDTDAAKWIKHGLATEKNPVPDAPKVGNSSSLPAGDLSTFGE